MLIRILVLCGMMMGLCVLTSRAQDLPAAEKALLRDTDHWGLAFSDQLTVFKKNFAEYAAMRQCDVDYVLGTQTSLRKVFCNKYWFRGDVATEVTLKAARNESEAFQLAVIPKTGFELQDINVCASSLKHVTGGGEILAEAIQVYRVGFVKTASPAPSYPTRHVGRWPDPLEDLDTFSTTGLDLGLLWYEVKIPSDAAAGDYVGSVTVSPGNAPAQELTVKVHVWDFEIPDRIAMPMAVWTRGDMGSDAYRDLCALFLAHHVDPISVGQTMDLAVLNRNLDFCLARGLQVFQTPGFKKPEDFQRYYDNLKAKGYLDKAMMYGAQDEPSPEQFRDIVIPKTAQVREHFPGLKVFLATDYYDRMTAGTDIWLADLSSSFLRWLAIDRPGEQRLWWYFCGIPIRTQMERPIGDTLRMLIDRDAIEHRLAYWMAYQYGVKGMFIWAGNRVTPGADLVSARLEYPYAGIHNGDGFLVYPGAKPSIRLKVIRDAAEDYAYLTQAAKIAEGSSDQAKQAQALLSQLSPNLFVDPHYFSRDESKLLGLREQLGELLGH